MTFDPEFHSKQSTPCDGTLQQHKHCHMCSSGIFIVKALNAICASSICVQMPAWNVELSYKCQSCRNPSPQQKQSMAETMSPQSVPHGSTLGALSTLGDLDPRLLMKKWAQRR